MAAILPPVRKLPSAEAPFSCVTILTNESEKTSFNISCTILPKKEKVPYMEMTRDNDQKRKKVPYMEVSRDTDAYKSSKFHFLKSLFNFHSQKSTRFVQLPAFYLVHPWPTTLQKPWPNWLAPTMWTLARVRQIWTLFLVQICLQLFGF